MSMTDMTNALSIIAANPGRGFFAGPRSLALVEKAELALGGRFPPSYREFVSQLGAGNYGAFEVYGVINEEFEDSAVPNGVWLTLNERRESALPPKWMIVGSTGDGDYYCVELQDGLDGPVIVYRPGFPPDQQRAEQAASDFGEFFLDQVRDQD